MNEKEKYLSIYQGDLSKIYTTQDPRGRSDGGYGRACWGEGILEQLARWRVRSLLDVGCGYGRFCEAAARFVPRVLGLDIASVASGQIIDNPAVEFIDGEAKCLPLPDRSVEWVTSFDCLEHCLEEDIDTILDEFDRVAVKGFVLSISYIPAHCAGVPLHMTVRPEAWWIDKLQRYGEVSKAGRVPITGVPYLICRKPLPARVICYCAGGLGNRLLPLASCAELAHRTGRLLTMLWRDNDFRCQAAFSELFENGIAVIDDDDLLQVHAPKIYADPTDVFYEADLNKKSALAELSLRYGTAGCNAVSLEDGAFDVVVYHNNLVPGLDMERVRRFLQRLRPVPALQSRIDTFAAQQGIDRTVMGVHARGTDFGVDVRRYAENIRKALEERPRQRFLVCSDDPEYEQQLKAMFPAQVIVRPKLDHVRRADEQAGWVHNTLTSKAAVQEAIVDMYLLARTDFKIYHSGSSFAMLVQGLQQSQDEPEGATGSPPRDMPDDLRTAYTMNGRIPLQHLYIDESRRENNLHYTKDLIERLLALAEKRRSCNYGDTDQWLYHMLDRFPISGQRVLVMGSQVPFYEAVCLANGAHPTTVEFQKIQSCHDDLKTMTVEELVQCEEPFDAAISISTFEHTGLGRYGDSLDPDGDLKAMLMLRTKVKHKGLLFLSVPMSKDIIVWNAHRIYGHLRFPHLIAGWDLLASIGSHADSQTYAREQYFQPIHVLQNNTEQHIDTLIELFKRHPNPAFVETGTALGRGVKAALRAGFKTIYSIEENRDLVAFNRSQFRGQADVHILHGESRSVLPQILGELDTKATFWLDAHRTGGGLNGGQAPYPLLEELQLIQSHPIHSHTLLIDDRRLFENEFSISEESVRKAVLGINPDYLLSTANSTPDDVAYGRSDILVAAPGAGSQAMQTTRNGLGRQLLTSFNDRRILYFCPEVSVASAGVRRLYRHVDQLARNGFNAFSLHPRPDSSTPDDLKVARLDLDRIELTDRDVVVIPEGHPNIMHALRGGPCRRFVIALNWDYIYKTLPDQVDWRMFGIERVLTVSPLIGRMISWSMRLPIHLIDTSIDHTLYYYDPGRKIPQVAYIQRKAAGIEALLRMLRSRKQEYVTRITWRALSGLPEPEYAAEIGKASIFLNLSPAEGFPTSCAEAMAAGTLVVGFDGVGGRQLLRNDDNSLLAPNGDYMTLAYTLAPLLDNLLAGNTEAWGRLIAGGLETARPMTLEKETQSLVRFWESVL